MPKKHTTADQKEFEAFSQLVELPKEDLDKLENAVDEALNHYKFKAGKVQN